MRTDSKGKIAQESSRLESVPFEKMRVRAGVSQREFRPSWANHLARNFSLEKFQTPVLNRVGDWFWIVDGQHRIEALKQWLGDWKGQQVQCRVYKNLSEKQEADLFLAMSDVKAIRAFDKFKIALTAELEDQTNVNAIVHLKGLKVSEQRGDGSVACVGTLLKVYKLGPDCLARALEIASNSFGNEGLESDIIHALGLVTSRYNGMLDDKRAVRSLSSVRGGVSGVRNRAERLRQQMGAPKASCIAAAIVEAHNRGKGGKKLPSWWKVDA